MEVEGRWTQRWAGASEYGKFVGVGGVRRTARALEVLDARAPGARLRVVRTAFRSQGNTSSRLQTPAGLDQLPDYGSLLRSPALVSKPAKQEDQHIDISEIENSSSVDDVPYQVTEPDDLKESNNNNEWKQSSSFINSLQSPRDNSLNSSLSSELDGKGIFSDIDNFIIKPSFLRLPSLTAEQSLKEIRGKIKELSSNTPSSNEETECSPKEGTSKVRSFIHQMETYRNGKAISNGTNSLEKRPSKVLQNSKRYDEDWYTRRKSYGFENMYNSPQTEKSNAVFDLNGGLESSIDSGISHSMEISEYSNNNVNNYSENNSESFLGAHLKESPMRVLEEEHYDSFQDWLSIHKKQAANALSNNRNSWYDDSKKYMKDQPTYLSNNDAYNHKHQPDDATKRHSIAVDKFDSNISLKSVLEPKKTSFKIPRGSFNYMTNGLANGDRDDAYEKRSKKVGFCKTELHIATESGQVDVVETDEKPPPSNNFRRRRRNTPLMSDIDGENLTVLTFSNPDLIQNSTYDNSLIESDLNNLGVKINYATETEVVKNNVTKSPDWAINDSDTPRGILKNKPTKPRPYHLGADGELGNGDFHQNHQQNVWGIKLKPVENVSIAPGISLNSSSDRHNDREMQVYTKAADALLLSEEDTNVQSSRESEEIEDSLPRLTSCSVVARIQNVQKQKETKFVDPTTVIESDVKESKEKKTALTFVADNQKQVETKTNVSEGFDKYHDHSPKMSPVMTKKQPKKIKEPVSVTDKSGKNLKSKHTSPDVYLPSMNPSLYKASTRKLREHELTFFGVKSPSLNDNINKQLSHHRESDLGSKPNKVKSHSLLVAQQTNTSVNTHKSSYDNYRSDDESPLYENLRKTSAPPIPVPAPRLTRNAITLTDSSFGLNSASKVLEILNGYGDDKLNRLSSSDDEVERRFKKCPIPNYTELDTIIESKSSDDRLRLSNRDMRSQSDSKESTKKNVKEKSNSKSTYANHHKATGPSASAKDHRSTSTDTDNSKARSRRLYKASSRDNLLHSRSSSEDAPQRPVVRKKTSRRGKATQNVCDRDSSPATIAQVLISKLNSLDKHSNKRLQDDQRGDRLSGNHSMLYPNTCCTLNFDSTANKKSSKKLEGHSADKIYGLTKTGANHYQLLERIQEIHSDDYKSPISGARKPTRDGAEESVRVKNNYTSKSPTQKGPQVKRSWMSGSDNNKNDHAYAFYKPDKYTDNSKKKSASTIKQKSSKEINKRKETDVKQQTVPAERSLKTNLSTGPDVKKVVTARDKKTSPPLSKKKISSRR